MKITNTDTDIVNHPNSRYSITIQVRLILSNCSLTCPFYLNSLQLYVVLVSQQNFYQYY